MDFVVSYYMRNNNKKSIKVVKVLMKVREEAKVNGYKMRDILIEYIGILGELNHAKAKVLYHSTISRSLNFEIKVFNQ